MDAIADYHHDFNIKGLTEFIRASPTSLRPNFAPSISFHFKSYVNLYDWNNDSHSAPDMVCLGEYEPAYRSYPPNTSGFISHDFENWRYSSLGKDLYSEAVSNVNPNITFGSEVHRDIQSEIWRIIEDVYSEPNRDSDHQCTILTRLVLHITINEHVLNECACQECRPVAEKKLLVPASEASIKKLNKVCVVAAAAHDLEVKKHENCRRSTRLKTSKKGSERPTDGDQCSICVEGFTAGKYATQMPCSHSFHKACIERWLRTSRECPICRYKMPAARDRRERVKSRRISEI